MYLKHIICGKGDLNSRTPTRMDSKSIAFDQTWQFPLFKMILYYLMKRIEYKKMLYMLKFKLKSIELKVRINL